jgi:FtsZ-binding cell division protein ZapB
VILTEEARKKYKDKVIRAVLRGLEEPHKTMRDQAMLARHERGQREEAERKADERVAEVERQAAERVRTAERRAEERIAAVRSEEAARFEKVRVLGLSLYEQNKKLSRENDGLSTERDGLNETVGKLGRENEELRMRARDYQERLSDIPMPEVMEKLGYGREQQGGAHVYRDARGQVLLRVEGQNLLDRQNEVVCRNSVDLVIHMRRHHQGVEGYDETRALEWLRDQFGDRRAAGAAVAHREQYALEFFGRLREERERSLVPQRGDDPWRGPRGKAEDHDRGSRGGRDDGRGGGGRGSGFSR